MARVRQKTEHARAGGLQVRRARLTRHGLASSAQLAVGHTTNARPTLRTRALGVRWFNSGVANGTPQRVNKSLREITPEMSLDRTARASAIPSAVRHEQCTGVRWASGARSR